MQIIVHRSSTYFSDVWIQKIIPSFSSHSSSPSSSSLALSP